MPTKNISLTRRIVDHFLMYSLGCLFLSLILVVGLQWQGMLVSHLYLVVIVPIVCLGVGTVVFRNMFRVADDIDGQIRNLVESPETSQLNPIYRPDALATGWNMFIEKISQQASTESIESRICKTMGNLVGHKHRVVFDCFPDGLVVTDADGMISHSNRSLGIILDIDANSDLAGQSIVEILKLQELKNGAEILEKTDKQIASLSFEIEPANLPAGTVIRISRHKLFDDKRNDQGFLWSIRDVTQAKLAENMRNQFVFTATHELRTPLSNIKAYAETLALDEQIEVEDQKKFCNIINAEVTRLGRFVDELLNVSQMEAGALSLSKQPTKLERLFNEVIEHNQPQIEKKQIDFTVNMPAKLPEASIDKDKMTAALVNLLGNAVKYTPDGGKVSFNVSQQKNQVAVEVEDSGYGISKDELEKVFDKFFRSADERVQSISGSGLGLAFASEAIRLHGGKLQAFSEINKGSKFVLTLPI